METSIKQVDEMSTNQITGNLTQDEVVEALKALSPEKLRHLIDDLLEASYKCGIDNIPVVNEQGREARDELIKCCEHHEKTSTLLSVN